MISKNILLFISALYGEKGNSVVRKNMGRFILFQEVNLYYRSNYFTVKYYYQKILPM